MKRNSSIHPSFHSGLKMVHVVVDHNASFHGCQIIWLKFINQYYKAVLKPKKFLSLSLSLSLSVYMYVCVRAWTRHLSWWTVKASNIKSTNGGWYEKKPSQLNIMIDDNAAPLLQTCTRSPYVWVMLNLVRIRTQSWMWISLKYNSWKYLLARWSCPSRRRSGMGPGSNIANQKSGEYNWPPIKRMLMKKPTSLQIVIAGHVSHLICWTINAAGENLIGSVIYIR